MVGRGHSKGEGPAWGMRLADSRKSRKPVWMQREGGKVVECELQTHCWGRREALEADGFYKTL